MCGSNGRCSACCPETKIVKEEISGNFNGSSSGLNQVVWQAPAGEYIEGTFQIFNSNYSTDSVTGTVGPGGDIVGPVPGGFTFSTSVNDNPNSFTISAKVGSDGNYRIILYRRIQV